MSRSLFALLRQHAGRTADGPTRREMLQATLAGAAGLLLSDRLVAAGPKPSGKRVLVVGAGFGGLACAHELCAAGYDVTVLEARSRPGGRVLTFNDFIKGKTVEGGAELIGSNHPTWVAYAKKFELEFLDVSDDGKNEWPIILGGKRLTAARSKELLGEVEEAQKALTELAKDVDADEPWKHKDAVALDRRSLAAWIDGLKVSDECKQLFTVQLASDNGVMTAWQSLLGNLAQVQGGGGEKFWSDTEVYRCKGGNSQLATKLAAKIGEARIRFKTAATAVWVGEKGVVVEADGQKFEGDDVVVAVPPSVWNRIRFDPPLPSVLAPQMGVNTKFLLQVKGRFWQDAKLSQYAITDGPVSQTWEGTDAQEGEGPVCLVCFAGGSAADIARQWPVGERVKNFLAELEKLYPEVSKHAQGSRFMDWPSDPLTRAGYSFPAPGQVTTVAPALREGVGGRLHFAGEHVSTAFPGYMEGALNSGVKLAQKLAKRDGVLKE